MSQDLEQKRQKWDNIISVLGLIPGLVYIPVMLLFFLDKDDVLSRAILLMGVIGFAGLVVCVSTREFHNLKLIFLAIGVTSYFIAIIETVRTANSKSLDVLVMFLIGWPYIMMAIMFVRVLINKVNK